jgi:hypothetical protein
MHGAATLISILPELHKNEEQSGVIPVSATH